MTDHALLKLNAALMGVLVALGVGAALYFTRPVIIPFALALFGAFAAEPAVRLLQRFRIPRWLGALLIVGLLFFVIQSMVGVVASAVDQFRDRLPDYLAALQQFSDGLPIPEATRARVRLDDPAFWTEVLPIGALVGSVGSWAGAVTSFVGNALLVMLIMVALIIARRSVDERLDRAAGEATGDLEQSMRVIDAIDAGIQRYMLLKTVLSAAMGVSFWLLLTAVGADFAVMWGFFAFLMNFIPTAGPVIATVPPVVQLLLQFGGEPGYALLSVILIACIPFGFGNLIEPKVFGESLNLNFFAVVFALMLWSFLWGLAGAVLSVPIMMAISLVCREVPALRPIHELLRS